MARQSARSGGTDATLQEVAKLAGVHAGTASRALNEATRDLVKPATIERVVAAAESLGYRPNYLARSFKTHRTLSVGVVIPDINNPLFPPILRGIEDRLEESGYMALLANTENDVERERRIFERLFARQVDGLVLATARRKDPVLMGIAKQGVPVVLVNRVVEGQAFSSVSVDDRAGARLVVDFLVRLGHERIAHLAGPQESSTGARRYKGFVAGMKANGLRHDPRLVSFATSFSIAEGARCAAELLNRKRHPTAIVAGNDMLALGCYTAIDAARLKCPGDVAVVGYNDMPFIERLSPPLTSVHIPHYEIGTRAAELMLERIESPDSPVTIVQLAPELVVRGSVGPVRQDRQAARAKGRTG